MSKASAILLGAGLLAAPLFALAAGGSELTIDTSGHLSGKSLVIMQLAGSNIFARAVWGNAYVRLVVLANASTSITTAHGGGASVSDLKVGDIFDAEGALVNGADALTFSASSIRDGAIQSESKTVSGTISSIDAANLIVTLTDKTLGKVSVVVPRDIQKGARTIGFGDLSVGDKVLSASGTYDYTTSRLQATALSVYQNPSIFTPHNFAGTLTAISGTTLPAQLTVSSGGVSYTVYLPANATLMRKNRSSASLSRFVVGDSVRFYGAIRETDLTAVDAEIVRDLNF